MSSTPRVFISIGMLIVISASEQSASGQKLVNTGTDNAAKALHSHQLVLPSISEPALRQAEHDGTLLAFVVQNAAKGDNRVTRRNVLRVWIPNAARYQVLREVCGGITDPTIKNRLLKALEALFPGERDVFDGKFDEAYEKIKTRQGRAKRCPDRRLRRFASSYQRTLRKLEDLVQAKKPEKKSTRAEGKVLTASPAGSTDTPSTCKLAGVISPAILATFHDQASWTHTNSAVMASVRMLPGGIGDLQLDLRAKSAVFKYFSQPSAALVLSDSAGNIIASLDAHVAAMGRGHRTVDSQRRNLSKRVKNNIFCKAAYVFFRLKLCAWRQGFDRGTKERNPGCIFYRGGGAFASLKREKKILSERLPAAIPELSIKVGSKFKLLGWHGARLR